MSGVQRQYQFSWSVTAWRRFTECPRAFFCHYPGAWGGGDRYAPPTVRERHRRKRRQPIDRWADTVFRDVVRGWLEDGWRRPGQIGPDDLRGRMLRRLVADWRLALRDERETVVFREWAEAGGVPDDAAAHFCELRDDVLARLERFSAGRTWAELAGLPFLAVRDFRVPTALTVAGVKVWSAPLLAWRQAGQVHVLLLHPRDRQAHPDWDWQAGVGEHLGRMLAGRLGLASAPVVRSVFAGEPGRGGLTVYGGRHAGEVAATIAAAAAAMNRGMEMEDYPACPSPQRCGHCEFRGACGASPGA